jgi:hypothetical protein
VPRWRASRSAVSALIARLPFRIDVIRPEGTWSARAGRGGRPTAGGPQARASGCGQGESEPPEITPYDRWRPRPHARPRPTSSCYASSSGAIKSILVPRRLAPEATEVTHVAH